MTESVQEIINLHDEYSSVFEGGLARTKLNKDKIESFLIPELRPVFNAAKACRRNLKDTPQNRQLIAYLKNNIFGAIPDYDAPIEIDHANGFMINGVLREIFMNRDVGAQQMQREFKNVDTKALADVVFSHFSATRRFDMQRIRMNVISLGSTGLNREIAAFAIKTVREMV